MRFETIERATYPVLGYAGVVDGDVVHLEHGRHVEVVDGRFTDGAWSGPFAGPVDVDAFHAGTGGSVHDDRLVLWSSSDLIDRVLLHHDDAGRTTFANSLPLLLLLLDDALDPADPYHRARTCTLDLGLDVAPRRFRTRGGRLVRHLVDEVAEVAGGAVGVRRRRLPDPFPDFATYRRSLGQTTAAVVANATDGGRAHPFRPLPSLSSGYDSTAVAVLAAEAGCRRALTMLRRDGSGALVDHPGEVAAVLGLELVEVERDRWRTGPAVEAALVAAASVTFMDVVTLTYGDLLDGTLLLTGYIGDTVWDPRNFRVSSTLRQGFGAVSGRGLAEHRLAHGYAIFPVPAIGQPAHASIRRITLDPELAPWTVGGDYDRPIARRIAEEAGVRRGTFAVRKYAGGARVGSSRLGYGGRTRAEREDELSEVMAPDGIAGFLDFVARHEGRRPGTASPRVRRALRWGPRAAWLLQRVDGINARVGRRWERYGLRAVVPLPLVARAAARFRVRPDHTYLLAHWGTAVLVDRYRPPAGDAPAPEDLSPP